MTRRICFLFSAPYLALFDGGLPPQNRTARQRDRRPEKVRYEPRRFRRQTDDPRA